MENTIELAVIINSFNRLILLRDALNSIAGVVSQAPIKAAIIIFEAGSTDGSVEFIKNFSENTPETEIICLSPSDEVNRSFSAGCNYAVEFAAKIFPNLKYCLFFETDNLIANQSALPLAIKLLEQEEKFGAVGFTVEKYNGKKTGFGACFPTPLSFILGQQLSEKLGLRRMSIKQWFPFSGSNYAFSDIVFTSPLLVRYAAWQSTGGMDAEKFPYSDCDSDWCWTADKKGWQLAVLDLPGVIHDNKMQSSTWSANRVINFHQARFQLLLKHRGQWIIFLKPLLFVRHCLEFCMLIFISLWSERAKKSLNQRRTLTKTVFKGYEA